MEMLGEKVIIATAREQLLFNRRLQHVLVRYTCRRLPGNNNWRNQEHLCPWHLDTVLLIPVGFRISRSKGVCGATPCFRYEFLMALKCCRQVLAWREQCWWNGMESTSTVVNQMRLASLWNLDPGLLCQISRARSKCVDLGLIRLGTLRFFWESRNDMLIPTIPRCRPVCQGPHFRIQCPWSWKIFKHFKVNCSDITSF